MAFEDLFGDAIAYVEGMAKRALEGEKVAVTIGGNPTYLPSELLVREIAQNPSFSDRSTSVPSMGRARGAYRVEFDVALEAWSSKSSLPAAASDVQRWALLLFKEVALDKTLGGSVIHAEPYVSGSGSWVDPKTKKFCADIQFGVHVKAELDPAASD